MAEQSVNGANSTGSLVRVCTLKGHEERIWCLAWRPCADPPQFVSSGEDRTLRFWKQRSGSRPENEDAWALHCEVDASDRHSRTLRSCAWKPDGTVLAVASFDATTSLWQEETEEGRPTFECVGLVTGHENEVKSAAFSISGEFFATCSRDKSVWIYDASTSGFDFECTALLQSHTQDVKMVKWHPNQDVLFSCSYDDTIKVWGPDGDDWACKETLDGHSSTVWCLAFDVDGARLATCSDDKTVQIWAPASEQQAAVEVSVREGNLQAWKRGPSVAAAAFVSPLFRGAAGYAATASDPAAASGASQEAGGNLATVKPRRAPKDACCAWRCVERIEGSHPRAVYSVDWLPFLVDTGAGAASAIATACGDNFVRVFQPRSEANLTGWSCIASAEAHVGDVNAAAWFSKPLQDGGALLATAGDDAEIAIWRLLPRV